MPTLQIRNLDESIYRLLAEEARNQRRSLAQQAAMTLAQALSGPAGSRSRRVALLREIAESSSAYWPKNLPLPAVFIREDRSQ